MKRMVLEARAGSSQQWLPLTTRQRVTWLKAFCVSMQGSAGQSFACFVVNGMKIKLVGEANDYVGKGMAGGDVTIVPPPGSPFEPSEASLVGNTCLYGATGGRLFVNGVAGQPLRLLLCGKTSALRNS